MPSIPKLNQLEVKKWEPARENFKGEEYVEYNKAILKLKNKFAELITDEMTFHASAQEIRDTLLKAYHAKHESFIEYMENVFEEVMIPRFEMSAGTIRNKRKSLFG